MYHSYPTYAHYADTAVIYVCALSCHRHRLHANKYAEVICMLYTAVANMHAIDDANTVKQQKITLQQICTCKIHSSDDRSSILK